MKIPRITNALNHISDDKITQADAPKKKRSALPLVCSLGGTCVAAAVLGVVLLNGKPVSKPPVITSTDVPSTVSSDIPSEPAPVSQTSSSSEVSQPENNALPNYFTPYEGSGFSIDRDNLPFEYNGGEPTKIKVKPYNGGMGMEALSAYDISELIGNNPWSKDLEITELPIFKGGRPTWTDTELSSELPDGYSLEFDTDIETKIKTVRYLAEKYSDLLGYTDYELDVWHDYFFSKTPNYSIELYESSDNAFDAIMNYNFATSYFYRADDKIFLKKRGSLDQYTCTGFYPTITANTAQEMLLEGKYSSTIPETEYLKDGMNEDRVKHVELVYHATNGGMQLPYYRFLVELDKNDNIPELNLYGAFYVPAISPEYLEGMDTEARYN